MSPSPEHTFDVAIIGAGPAGMTAAIYCSRGRLSTVVLERGIAGGQMALTELIENFPGFPDGISGFELADRMKRQAQQFGAEILEITAVSTIRPEADATYTVVTDQENVRARTLLLVPGVEARKSGIPGEAEFIGRGVSWCATCDGALYKGKQVAVVGGGDSAIEEGLFLAKFADAVHVIHRRDELRAARITQERAFANPKMHFIWDSVPRRILGEDAVSGIEYENVKTHELATLPVSGVFLYIGQLPNTGFLQGFVDLDPSGSIRTNELLCTSACGVFAAGDAHTTAIKQIAWAVGEGALAAIEMEKYLDSLECATPAQWPVERAAQVGGKDQRPSDSNKTSQPKTDSTT
jgi:thioredoxin reductase (NADPH)